MPKDFAYSLRFPAKHRNSYNQHWKTTILFSMYANPSRLFEDAGKYYDNDGFLAIQNAIAKAFLKVIPTRSPSSSNVTMPQIYAQQFPMPRRNLDHAALSLRELTPIFLMLVLCFAFMNTVRLVSIEKEKQLKEAMKIMGLSSWIHYLGWFIRTAIMLSITMLLITVLLAVCLIHSFN